MRAPGEQEADDRQGRGLVGQVPAHQGHVGAEGGPGQHDREGELADDDGEGEEAALRSAARMFGRTTRKRVGPQPAPRLCAASVSVAEVDGAQPRVDGAEDVREGEHDVAGHEERGAGDQGEGRPAVDADQAEDQHDRRDDEGQQREGLDEGRGARGTRRCTQMRRRDDQGEARRRS